MNGTPFTLALHVYLGDVPRETNCVHAALVEMQSSGGSRFLDERRGMGTITSHSERNAFG